MSATQKQADVVVLGAGPAGYVCAIRLAQLGKKVTVIDTAELGGVCLNRGCIPSKALIYAATLFEKMQHAETMGITVTGAKINMPKLIAWKETVVKQLTGGVGALLKANGCEVIQGYAKFTGPTDLEIETPKKEKIALKFSQCVVATGSRPTAIPGFEIDQELIMDSTGALEQESIPETLLCIGGGYIGLELGTFFAKIGTKVTVVEAGPQLLGIVDPALVKVVEKGLKKRGVEVLVNTKVKGCTKKKNAVEVSYGDQTKTFDKVLVTVGRKPNTDGIDLEKAGVKLDTKGFIHVDAFRRTNIPTIYAIGDVAGQPLLAHKGSKEGIIAAEVIGGKKSVWDVVAIPAVIFTDPEIATVGLSEQEAKEKGLAYDVGMFPFAANGRALSISESDGFVKIIADKNTKQLLGCHIVGPEASNLIAEATLALEMGASVEDLALTVHAHPTLPEALMEGAEATLGHAIHIFQKKSKPQGQAEATL